MGGAVLARRSPIDYDRLCGEVEGLCEQGMTTHAAMLKAVSEFPEHGQPDRDSIHRNLRRWWGRKHGSSSKPTSQKKVGKAPQVFPGLGVLYKVLKQKTDTINIELGLPLSEERKRQLTAEGKAMREFLERRRDQLRALTPEECQAQVRNSVINVEGVDAASLLASEIKEIDELIDSIHITFVLASIYI
jgi:hypothetical protein